jgi:diketogulonate reductase-like aldo/keto reductase
MRMRKFGSTGLAVSIVGQGTWNLPTRGSAVEEAKVALRAGIACGMMHIDTAEMYGDGCSEEIVGAVIRDLPRERLFLVSKVLPSNASYVGTLRACEASLRRLGTEYLDCYLLHWRGGVPLAETMRALEQLIDAGKIRTLGVSNFDVADLADARSVLTKHRIVCNQVFYALNTRGIERHLLPYCRENEIAVVGYSPLGSGKFPSERSARGRVLEDLALRRGVTRQQIALAFLTRCEGTFVIPKAMHITHVRDNAQAGDLVLTDEEITSIDRTFPVPEHDAPLAVI